MRRRSHRPELAQPPAKPIGWCGSALEDLRSFPDEARREAGFQLGQLQEGGEADDWKPMTTVGAGTIEIRIHTRTEHRVFVVAKFADRIYVLHAFFFFQAEDGIRDIDLAKRRYRQLVKEH